MLSLGLFAIFIALQYLFGQVEYTGTLRQVLGPPDIQRHLLVGAISLSWLESMKSYTSAATSILCLIVRANFHRVGLPAIANLQPGPSSPPG